MERVDHKERRENIRKLEFVIDQAVQHMMVNRMTGGSDKEFYEFIESWRKAQLLWLQQARGMSPERAEETLRGPEMVKKYATWNKVGIPPNVLELYDGPLSDRAFEEARGVWLESTADHVKEKTMNPGDMERNEFLDGIELAFEALGRQILDQALSKDKKGLEKSFEGWRLVQTEWLREGRGMSLDNAVAMIRSKDMLNKTEEWLKKPYGRPPSVLDLFDGRLTDEEFGETKRGFSESTSDHADQYLSMIRGKADYSTYLAIKQLEQDDEDREKS